jgi:hypothetical protein
MSIRTTTRLASALAAAALATFGAQAQEAMQWNPQADSPMVMATSDASQNPSAWSAMDTAATQFRDGMSPGTMSTREHVKSDLRMARERGLMNDTGEGGATDRVLAQRESYIQEEHDRIVAMNAQQVEDDMLASLIANEGWAYSDGWETASLDSLAPASVTVIPADDMPSFPLDGDAYAYEPRIYREEVAVYVDADGNVT